MGLYYMFKIIKWSAIASMMITLLAVETVQAGKRTPLQQTNVESASPPVEGARHQVAVDKDSGAIAQRTQRASFVSQLDEKAKMWNYTLFDFAVLHDFFAEKISNAAFIEATKNRGYSCIPALAKALVDSDSCDIDKTSEAKFFVYSALKGMHDRSVDDDMEDRAAFSLLKQANAAMIAYTMDRVEYNEPELPANYAKTMLSAYPDAFISDSQITRLVLKNGVGDLVSVINAYGNVKQKYKKIFCVADAIKKPQVSELLSYYPKDHAQVLVFLVAHPIEAEMVMFEGSEKPMKGETELKRKIATTLKKLWDVTDKSDLDGREQLATMSLNLFAMNPLIWSAESQAAKVKGYHSETTVASGSASASADVEKMRTVLQKYYTKFIKVLPMDDTTFTATLFTKGLLPGNLKEDISVGTRAEKATKFIDSISGDFDIDSTTSFEALIDLMSKTDFHTLRKLSKDIKSELK